MSRFGLLVLFAFVFGPALVFAFFVQQDGKVDWIDLAYVAAVLGNLAVIRYTMRGSTRRIGMPA